MVVVNRKREYGHELELRVLKEYEGISSTCWVDMIYRALHKYGDERTAILSNQ